MPALTSLSPHDPVEERPAHEPSMEEILASIRRIISDDQSLTAHRDNVRPDNNPAGVHDIRGAAVSPPPAEAQVPLEPVRVNATAPDGQKAMLAVDEKPFAGLSSYPAAPPIAAPASPPDRKLADFADMRLRRPYDDDADKAPSRHNVEPLPRQAQAPVAKPPVFDEAEPIVSPTTDAAVASSFNALFASRLLPNPEMLAELTRDLLRPMLKTWLDDNLPVMVERLVRAEIERVARGGR